MADDLTACPQFGDIETSDPLVVKVRDVFERISQLESWLLDYARELDAMPDTGLIGPGAVASRIRALVGEADRP